MKKIAINFLLMIVFLCALGANVYAADINVTIQDNFFAPSAVTVNVGDKITWTNNGVTPHTTTSGTSCPAGNGIWNSGSLSSGQSFSFTFTQAGTFPYFCSNHCFTGTVVVNPVVTMAPAPSGPQVIVYVPTVTPEVNTNLVLAKPLAIGPLAEGGSLINIQVALPQFQVPVDIYVIAYFPTVASDAIFNVTPDLAFQNISLEEFSLAASAGVPPAGMAPWMASVTAPVNSTLYADIPVSAVPPGDYAFFVLVTLPNNLFDYDLFGTAFALGVPINATLTGGQEVPPVATAATATANLAVDFTSGEVIGTMNFTGLTSNSIGAHIHDGAAGSNGPIIVAFSGGTGTTSGIWSVSGVLTPSQLDDLRANLLYVNIHSVNFPSGEIRAQLIFPNLNMIAAMSGDKEVPAVPTSAEGIADFSVNVNTGELTGTAAFSGLSSNATAAHIHFGGAGVNGGIIIPLVGGAGGTSGTWSVPAGTVLTAAQLTALSNNLLYVNIHSVNFSGGEIRSQLYYPQGAPTP